MSKSRSSSKGAGIAATAKMLGVSEIEVVAAYRDLFHGSGVLYRRTVADRLAQILALPEEERAAEARKMIVELPSLVPNDPTMAEVITGQMEAAFKEQLRKQPDGGAPAANKAVPNAKE